MPGTPGGPGSFGPVPGATVGARGAWVGAFLSAVAFGRFSIVIGSSQALHRAADAAVLPDPPEVDDQEDGGDQREGDDVHDVEAQERPLPTWMPPSRKKLDSGPRSGAYVAIWVPTVIAQKAIWSQGSR